MNTSVTEISAIERPGLGKIFLHVIISWFLGIVIAVILSLLYSITHGTNSLLETSNIKEACALLFLFLFFGMPSLFIGWLFFLLVNSTVRSTSMKFVLWFIAVIVSITINMIMFGGGFSPEMADTFWQLYAGAAISILIRARQFLRLIQSRSYNAKSDEL